MDNNNRNNNDLQNEDHSVRTKEGIEKARTQNKGRWGRPSLLDRDSDLPLKASKLRDLGHSWSEIGCELGVSRSSARRLASLCKKASNSQTEGSADSPVPNRSVSETCAEKACDPTVGDKEGGDVCSMAFMPKSFEEFKIILKKADVERPKRTEGL